MKITVLNEQGQGHINPDLCWNGIFADLEVAGDGAVNGRGAFVADNEIATAVIICLMTDVGVDETEIREGDTQRGWPGDGFDLQGQEVPLGSKLWLLRRSVVDNDRVPRLAERYAEEALQTLIEQGVCVRVEVQAIGIPLQNRLELDVSLYGRSGTQTFHEKFEILWEQVNSVSRQIN